MMNRYPRPQAAPPKEDRYICIKCGKALKKVDVGLHKKMINRGAERWMCVDCLGEHLGVSREELLRKAEEFKKMGCTLFC